MACYGYAVASPMVEMSFGRGECSACHPVLGTRLSLEGLWHQCDVKKNWGDMAMQTVGWRAKSGEFLHVWQGY